MSKATAQLTNHTCSVLDTASDRGQVYHLNQVLNSEKHIPDHKYLQSRVLMCKAQSDTEFPLHAVCSCAVAFKKENNGKTYYFFQIFLV